MVVKKFISILSLLVAVLLAGCTSDGSKSFEAYTNARTVEDSGLVFTFTEPSAYASTDWQTGELKSVSVSFDLELLNKNPKPYTFKYSNAKIVRERDKAEYDADPYSKYAEISSILSQNPTVLECDVKQSIYFSATIPTKLEDENYYFVLNYESKRLKYYLYDSDLL